MNSFFRLFPLMFTFFFMFSGCASTKNSEVEKVVNSNTKYSIVLGSGGGFTGSYEGYYIDTLNNVFKWEGKTFTFAKKNLLGKISEEQARILMQNLFDNKILSTSFKEHGNITSYISFQGDVLEHSISWIGIEPGEKVPENVRNFYSTIIQIIKSTITK